ncbi:uncharacterized protein B0I36DRAFT_105821 [Microdochium trichocladiopsis]|uniref:Uncharacterized protein n=1 Tax=Microdochium trichocladiopsis TaxID=1682393 RepID=A0A9P9BPI7_9PEZI|nr:uncharacterized protein B0I36DRAFT_105821 [Microdochium trichocladiopsis]KAH7033174.1 hypothetical protein B0I36DRAFT_105821 [Microdochium trichocladiopsis]
MVRNINSKVDDARNTYRARRGWNPRARPEPRSAQKWRSGSGSLGRGQDTRRSRQPARDSSSGSGRRPNGVLKAPNTRKSKRGKNFVGMSAELTRELRDRDGDVLMERPGDLADIVCSDKRVTAPARKTRRQCRNAARLNRASAASAQAPGHSESVPSNMVFASSNLSGGPAASFASTSAPQLGTNDDELPPYIRDLEGDIVMSDADNPSPIHVVLGHFHRIRAQIRLQQSQNSQNNNKANNNNNHNNHPQARSQFSTLPSLTAAPSPGFLVDDAGDTYMKNGYTPHPFIPYLLAQGGITAALDAVRHWGDWRAWFLSQLERAKDDLFRLY